MFLERSNLYPVIQKKICPFFIWVFVCYIEVMYQVVSSALESKHFCQLSSYYVTFCLCTVCLPKKEQAWEHFKCFNTSFIVKMLFDV